MITVVIPCWNAERWIARAIESVLAQNQPNLELIVIDDGSTDASLDVIRGFEGRVRWETGPNLGACAARNRGLALAQGDYVLFLDADDYVEGDLIQGLYSAAAKSGADVAIGPSVVEVVGSGRVRPQNYADDVSRQDVICSIVNFEGPQSGALLWRKKFLLELGAWDNGLGRLQDYFLYLKALARCRAFAISATGRCVYTDHDGPDRISRRRSDQTELSVVAAYERDLAEFRGFLTAQAERALAEQIYGISLFLYRKGLRDRARAGFALCRSLGLRGHAGNLRHRVLCSLLGLPLKEALAGVKRRSAGTVLA